jgi:hypothetical protein
MLNVGEMFRFHLQRHHRKLFPKTGEDVRALGPCKHEADADFTFSQICPSIISEP